MLWASVMSRFQERQKGGGLFKYTLGKLLLIGVCSLVLGKKQGTCLPSFLPVNYRQGLCCCAPSSQALSRSPRSWMPPESHTGASAFVAAALNEAAPRNRGSPGRQLPCPICSPVPWSPPCFLLWIRKVSAPLNRTVNTIEPLTALRPAVPPERFLGGRQTQRS